MLQLGERWWLFAGAQIDIDSEFELHQDGQLILHDAAGNLVKGNELSDAQIEQLARDELLADVLELAVAKLRSGEGWGEGTISDVLLEILHVYPANERRHP